MYMFDKCGRISGGLGGGAPGSIFAGYLPLASQSSYSIIVYSVANFKLPLSHVQMLKCKFRDPHFAIFSLCIYLINPFKWTKSS